VSSSPLGIRRNRRARSIAVPGRFPWGPLLKRLEVHYGSGSWRVPALRRRGADPFEVLVSTVLSHRTRDEVTERATRRVLRAFPTPSKLAAASEADLMTLISEVGLARTKASGLRSAAELVTERFGGRIPMAEAELRELPLVGKKTARAILLFAFGKPAIPVDSHIHRVVNRLGVVETRSVNATADALGSRVPRKYWGLLNPVLVQHGQNICLPRRPRCGSCPVSDLCPKVGVDDWPKEPEDCKAPLSRSS